jgi:hypothetical protein
MSVHSCFFFGVLCTIPLVACTAGEEAASSHRASDGGPSDSSIVPRYDASHATGGSSGTGGTVPKTDASLDATAGAGGAAGTDATTGTGGAPLVDVVSEPIPPCTTCAMSVQYKNRNTTASSNEPSFVVWVKNTGTAPIVLGTVTLRYWYTADGQTGETYNCDYAQLGCGVVSAKFVTMSTPTASADTYLEITLTGSGTLAAGASSGEIQVRFHGNYSKSYDQSNDYSWDGSLTASTGTDDMKVTGYLSGELAWGAEPGGGSGGEPLDTEPSGNDP